MVCEWLEKKEKKSGRYTEILKIFRITAMLLGILMEKISRVQAAGGTLAGNFAAYVTADKENRIYRNKVRHIINKNGNGHVVATVAAGGKSKQVTLPGKRTAGNKYRDRRLLIQSSRTEFMKNAP